jgi:NDP-sugar pyrophosphorylase family protein
MQGIILAAGLGKRLRPVTERMSKGMAPILGRPIVQRVINDVASEALITEFVVVVSPHRPDIQEYLEHAADEMAVQIEFVVQEEQLGMAHALNSARDLIRGPFLLAACDSLYPRGHIRELRDTHEANRNNATLSLMKLPEREIKKSGIVRLIGTKVLGIVEKPDPLEAPSDIGTMPLYLFEEGFLPYLDKVPRSVRGEYELQDAMRLMIEERGGVQGVFTSARYDLTTADHLLAINMLYFDTVYRHGWWSDPRRFPEAHIALPVYIEEDVDIAPGARVGPKVYLGTGVRVEGGARIQDALVLLDSVVPKDTEVRDKVYCSWAEE